MLKKTFQNSCLFRLIVYTVRLSSIGFGNRTHSFLVRLCSIAKVNGYRSFRYKVVSLQVVSLQIEVDSLHHDRFATLRSRFATCLEFEVTIKDTGVNKRYLQTTYYRQILEANIKTSFRYALLLFVPRSEKNHWSRNHCVNARAK